MQKNKTCLLNLLGHDSNFKWLLGLPWVDKHRLTSVPIHLVLVILLSLLHSFQTTCIWEVKSIGIVTVHVLKVPLKYWDMLPKLSGWLLGLIGQSCGHHGWGWRITSTETAGTKFNVEESVTFYREKADQPLPGKTGLGGNGPGLQGLSSCNGALKWYLYCCYGESEFKVLVHKEQGREYYRQLASRPSYLEFMSIIMSLPFFSLIPSMQKA